MNSGSFSIKTGKKNPAGELNYLRTTVPNTLINYI